MSHPNPVHDKESQYPEDGDDSICEQCGNSRKVNDGFGDTKPCLCVIELESELSGEDHHHE